MFLDALGFFMFSCICSFNYVDSKLVVWGKGLCEEECPVVLTVCLVLYVLCDLY